MSLPTQNPQPTEAPAFRIRPGRRGDADAIGKLLAELGYPDVGDASTVHWVMSHPEMEVLVARDAQDRPVGLLTLSHRPQLRLQGRIVDIDELVVTESWRRRGVGRALLQAALDRARALSAKRVELVTHKGRGEAIREFYQHCDFEEADALVMRSTADLRKG